MTLFAPAQLEKLTAALPDDATPGELVTVGLDIDEHGIGVVAHFRRSTTRAAWELQGGYSHAWTGNDSLHAEIIYRRAAG